MAEDQMCDKKPDRISMATTKAVIADYAEVAVVLGDVGGDRQGDLIELWLRQAGDFDAYVYLSEEEAADLITVLTRAARIARESNTVEKEAANG